ncbi:GTPase IMAP family member 4 isoform X2 [Oncorhynchus tshawytscha]|uniref:GTPase IMAP family member 4 isoform X2 n=1 Tax=Oncorhynchus tshawytscha TaxID=74940 RepID=UPI001C3C67A6|nr:GTPase IMAP family member 4 isoform X2 [Oncorhynchus tshawytscha]XP_024290005.2 GTPase IMAP family member 4 isoform X2 [Oncorhynchus tshawytscha]
MGHLSKPVQQTSRPLQVVLLGKTGAGMSATGNTILGRKDFRSKKRLKSVTANIEKQNVTIEGIDLVVYDTPGFCNPDQSEEQIQEKFQDVLKLTSSGPRVFLLVVKTDRLTEEEMRVISKVEGLLGESLLKQTWILFTRGDELEDQTIEEFIADSDDLTEVMRKYSGRYHVFNNKRGDPEQVKSLLEKTFICLNSTLSRSSSIRNLPERRMVLLGKSSVGKSATGNTILGGTSFHSESNWSPVTTKTEMKQAAVDGRDVSVVDTPGLFDTTLPAEELAMEIGRSIYESSPGPHAFLIVLRVNDRFTEQEKKAIEILESLFGSGLAKHAIILFTHGDALEGNGIEKLIGGNRDIRGVLEQCGGRYHVLNNKARGNRDQVTELMEKIDRMVEENGGTCYTNEMFEDAARIKKEEEERIQREEEERIQREIEERIQREEEERIQRVEEERFNMERRERERERMEMMEMMEMIERIQSERMERRERERERMEMMEMMEMIERIQSERMERRERERERMEMMEWMERERIQRERERPKQDDKSCEIM